ncbi:hypothetical protein VNO78_21414 [Psophocarpus tetragonolobus]|uniref:Secreted protein n=1 Tax=Psophocarpus tetragonolobus TaxID=3891 RepID=A0AAN9XI40_PSOTE
MARNLSIFVFCIVAMLLLVESHLPFTLQLQLLLLSHQTRFSMASLKAVFNHKIVLHVVWIDAQTHSTRSHVCSSAKSVVPHACVCHQELMATKRFVLATTIGRPKGEDRNALEELMFKLSISY